jgi:hypothetical protein
MHRWGRIAPMILKAIVAMMVMLAIAAAIWMSVTL